MGAWFVNDIGTVLFSLNMNLYPGIGLAMNMDAYETWFYQFKEWLVDAYETAYGYPVSEDDLQQGCRWRKDFIYKLCKIVIWVTPPGPSRQAMKSYIDFYDTGNMP